MKFKEAVNKYGYNWRKIAQYVGNKTAEQVEKYAKKLKKKSELDLSAIDISCIIQIMETEIKEKLDK